MKRPMKTGRWLLAGLFVFGMVTSAVAQFDPSKPGSVLVFPYFERGNVDVHGVLHPKTEIEISVTCPIGASCQEGGRVKLMAHWVCPADQKPQNKYICRETDFVMQTTVDSTLTLNPDNNPRAQGFYASTAPPQGNVRVAPCKKGYLIVWVVDQFDYAIKFDGLIGDAVVRQTSDAAEAYNAIPIQAARSIPDPSPNTYGSTIIGERTDKSLDGFLNFNNIEYEQVSGVVLGSVRFDESTTSINPAEVSDVRTSIVLLTLDVNSNRSNSPTFVDLNFYNRFEVPTSTFVEFICWGEFNLSRKIDENLTRLLQDDSRKGYFRSGQAEKIDFLGTDPQTGPVTLLGIVFTRERGSAGVERSYSYSLYNDGTYVNTYFAP